MDPILILIIVFFALVAIIAYLARNRMPAGGRPKEEPTSEVFEFEPDEQNAVPHVTRRTRVVAPAQSVNGSLQKIRVIAQPLPRFANLVVPAEKGIESLDILIINPAVRLADSEQEINDFDPPLTVTVWLDKQDMSAGKLTGEGVPDLSLITGYQAADGWKFERLFTDRGIDPETGQGLLSAQVKTLAPKDPMWAGRP